MRLRLRTSFALVLLSLGVVVAGSAATTPAGDWPEFRGPTGQGNGAAVGLPVEWSASNNIAWKQEIPGAGWSSPVVSRGRVYLTAAIANEKEPAAMFLLCYESATGRLAWRTEIFSATESPAQPAHDRSLPASPTPIVEGERIYVYFGHHGAAALDLAGKVVWRKSRVRFDPVPANGGSPILAGDLLVYVADCATAPFVMALDKHTGAVRWQVRRPIPDKLKFSFSTPLFITAAGRPQIIVPASGAVSALDPKDGRELWRVRYNDENSLAPRPVFAHGLVFVATGYLRAELLAIRPDGAGDVTDTHVAWRLTKGAPITPAMVAVGEELYAVNDAGVATCWDAKTGQVRWQERLPGIYSAAPVAADGKVYFQSETGLGTVVAARPEFTKLAANPLEERMLASPAVAENSLFIRTERALYRVGGASSRASTR